MSDIEKVYQVYRNHVYDTDRIQLLEEHNLKVSGSVPSVIWELLGSILTNRVGTGNTGADLDGWEVKSACDGGSYEYQYHLNTGLAKLEEDCIVNHLFFSYSSGYKDVVVKAMRGPDIASDFFEVWKPQYLQNYDHNVEASQRRQRFRRAISNGYVRQNGLDVLEIRDGQLVQQDRTIIPLLNQEFDERIR